MASETPQFQLSRRARGRRLALRGGIALGVLSVALVAPGVNEYAFRQLASLGQPRLAREWFTITHLPLSDAPPENGLSRWVIPAELAERKLWTWDAQTLGWMDRQAHQLPTPLRELRRVDAIYLLPPHTRRKEVRNGDQIYWTLESVASGTPPSECGVTYSVARGVEIALSRECLASRDRAGLAKIVHELVHAWDLEQGERFAPPQWDAKRGLWSERSLSTWVDAPESWFELSWRVRPNSLEISPRKMSEPFVSERAKFSPLEDLAETAEKFFLSPQDVRNQAPRKAAWLSKRLFPRPDVPKSAHGKKK